MREDKLRTEIGQIIVQELKLMPFKARDGRSIWSDDGEYGMDIEPLVQSLIKLVEAERADMANQIEDGQP